MMESPFARSKSKSVERRDVSGVKEIVRRKIQEMPAEMSPDLIKIAAWIHTLEKDAKEACEAVVRAKFVEPFAMSLNADEYRLALETSSMLSDPGYALAVLRGEVVRDFAHRAGSEGVTSEWESERLVRNLESVVNAQKAKENRSKTISISGEFEKSNEMIGEEDDIGGPVDAGAAKAYESFGARNKDQAA